MDTTDENRLFKHYENDYCTKSTEIARKLNLLPSLHGDRHRLKASEIESDIRAADIVIRSMDMEARQLATAVSQPLLGKVKEYKADLAHLREELKNAASAAPIGDAARAELGLGGDYYSTAAGQRERMLAATQRLDKSSQRLAGARETLAQTEDLGANILVDLHGQRETLLHTRNTLEGADESVSKARKLLSNMTRRILHNKVIMFGIIAFLLAGIILIIYIKLRPGSS